MIVYFVVFIFFVFVGIYLILRMRNIQIWFKAYLREIFSGKFSQQQVTSTKHVYFCLVDHYEPYWGKADDKIARRRVDGWLNGFPKAVEGHVDSDGNKPKHTFFYPEEEYHFDVIESLKTFVDAEIGDVEIHLHHDDDTADNLRNTLNSFKHTLFEKHGLLRKNDKGEIIYSFIHGNWALDNSRPDGRYCGVDNEILVLKETGCYLDLTMPSAPSDTQTKIINSIYFAKGEDGCQKGHDSGTILNKATEIKSDELLIIQGPLTLNWTNRKMGLIPRVESAEISANARPSQTRLNLWEKCNVHVGGEEDHIFIKLHTHGAEDDNIKMFFEDGEYDNLLTLLENKYRDSENYRLHYVSAWQMYQKVLELKAR